MRPKNDAGRHVSSPDKMGKNSQPPFRSGNRSVSVSTTDKQLMAYVTIANIESETSFLQINWPLFILKELEDNAYDWLNDCYHAKNPEDVEFRKITVRIWITSQDGSKNSLLHVAVRNSNLENLPVFEDLSKTFDFHSWNSTKRNQHRMTTGRLGDALKRCLGMGYALWTSDYNPEDTFDEKQWDQPLIIRCNKKEFKVFIRVDFSRQLISSKVEPQNEVNPDIDTDTEVEVSLPIGNSLDEHEAILTRMKRYYDIYKIGKSRTNFTLCMGEEE